MRLSHALLVGLTAALTCTRTFGDGGYERAGWIARIGPGLHQVMGRVTIVDDRTLQVEHFTYDGGAPLVYMTLGALDTYQSFFDGLQVPPVLDRPFDDESFTLTLPGDATLDGYRAISVWCAEFHVNFGSALFTCPPDVDGSFFVDFADLLQILGAWGPCDDCLEDLDGDGDVGFSDVLTVLRDWGPCGTF